MVEAVVTEQMVEDYQRGYVERPGRTSPPYPGHGMQPGERLRQDWGFLISGEVRRLSHNFQASSVSTPRARAAIHGHVHQFTD